MIRYAHAGGAHIAYDIEGRRPFSWYQTGSCRSR